MNHSRKAGRFFSMRATPQTFRKQERLCSRKTIEELFSNGKSFNCQPFQVIWNFANDNLPAPAQVAISIPKKTFRSAVLRNRIRRKIREAYRRQKQNLYNHLQGSQRKIVFMIILKGIDEPDYDEIFHATGRVISRLSGQINTADSQPC